MATVPDFDPERQCDLDPFIPEPPAPAEPTLPFAEWIRLAAATIRFHGNGSDASLWLAGKIEALADEAQSLQARMPSEFDARHDVMERDHGFEMWAKAEAQGYDKCVRDHHLDHCYQ